MSGHLLQSYPPNLRVKATWSNAPGSDIEFPHGTGGQVQIGEYTISMEEFLGLAVYAIQNVAIEGESDPRFRFIESMKAMAPTERLGEPFFRTSVSYHLPPENPTLCLDTERKD